MWSCIAVVLVLTVQWVHWRIQVPKRQSRRILEISFLVYVAIVLITQVGDALLPPTMRFVSLAEDAALAIFILAWALAYTITYVSVEAVSPTLVLMRGIARSREAGVSLDELYAYASDQVLVLARLDDLVRDHMVTRDADRYVVTSRGRRFVSIFVLARNLLRLGKGG